MRDLGLKTWRRRSNPTTSTCSFRRRPAIAPSLAIQWFKGISARSPFAGFLPLRRVCRCSHLWAPSYSVGTAGQVSAETIRRSIARAAHVRTRR